MVLNLLGTTVTVDGKLMEALFDASPVVLDSYKNQVMSSDPRMTVRIGDVGLIQEGSEVFVMDRCYLVQAIKKDESRRYATIELSAIRDSERRKK